MAADTTEEPDRYVPLERYEQLMDVLRHRRAVRGYKRSRLSASELDSKAVHAMWLAPTTLGLSTTEATCY